MKHLAITLFALSGVLSTVYAAELLPESTFQGKPVVKKVPRQQTETAEPSYFVAELSKAGDLAEVLGDNASKIDSLIVTGPVNSADFHTMWDATFNGKVEVINLEKAEVENNAIPANAFWNFKEQMAPDMSVFYAISLRRIMLPESITEIGEEALAYAAELTTINIPEALKSIGESAFYDCRKFNIPVADFKNLKSIGNRAFMYTSSWTGEVNFPSTLESIGEFTFYMSRLTGAGFAGGAATIGQNAFSACNLKELELPAGYTLAEGGSQFSGNFELTSVVLPADMELIPDEAFRDCLKLAEVTMPEKLESIEAAAFVNCAEINRLVFPSTLKYLGKRCFDGIDHLVEMYCAAPVPPVCEKDEANPEITPFGKYCTDCNDIHCVVPVYIPVGTREDYLAAWGWDYFGNFIETNDFPSVGVDAISVERPADNTIYDLFGRKVTAPVKGQLYISNGKKIIF